ncbi:MAG TPA: DNA translocase FtsK 4TM domain-containing protein, partial [Mucilaginibacter sp.]
MPVKANQFKSNSFKDENQPRQAGGNKAEKERGIKRSLPKLPRFDVENGRAVKIAGLFSLLLSVYFLIAFTSYLFTWQEDQSYISKTNGGWHNLSTGTTVHEIADLSDPTIRAQNWLGKFGALLSNQFIYEWFGVASFIFVFVFFVAGYRLLFKARLFSIRKTLAYSLFSIVFISVAIAYFHSFIIDYPHYLEGGFGFWSNRLLAAQIGEAGTGGLLVFLALTVLVIAYNIDFKIPKRKDRPVAAMEIEEVSPEPVELIDEEPSMPLEWPRGNNKIRETHVSSIMPEPMVQEPLRQEPLYQPPMEQMPSYHEPVVLRPENTIKHEPEEEEEIPLTIDTNRPLPELSVEQADEAKQDDLLSKFGVYDHKLDLASYRLPHIELLENHGSNKISVNAEELEANKNKIVETLNHYNIEIDKIKATIGPTVTLYEIIPAPGVRISKIKNLEDDIALSLAALGIRIIAPMPGKGTIGIEVPNQNPEMVSMRSILSTEKYQNTTM